ncbi:MAG: hypothetical protein QOF73_376 [Thermomicrobiales bacterium]|jgi:hypothetical protein|nr:hypothetical protein [Thermomicrobiales bacterium]
MDQQQADQLRLTDVQRPPIMEDLTKTQMFEIQSQFDEGDREGFNWRAESFGWTREQADEVWAWFEQGHRAVEMLAAEAATP